MCLCKIQTSVQFRNRKKNNLGTINIRDGFTLRKLTTEAGNVNHMSPDQKLKVQMFFSLTLMFENSQCLVLIFSVSHLGGRPVKFCLLPPSTGN